MWETPEHKQAWVEGKTLDQIAAEQEEAERLAEAGRPDLSTEDRPEVAESDIHPAQRD